jgi:Mrp family chromosome partitioning ATPase
MRRTLAAMGAFARRMWRVMAAGVRKLAGLAQRARTRRAASSNEAPPRATLDPASAPVEAVHQFAQARRARIIGVAGVERDSGASLVAEALARRCVAGRLSTLLIDATGAQLGAESLASAPSPDAAGFDRLALRPTGEELLPMRDIARLRHMLQQALGAYDAIVVDLPAARDAGASALPATIIGKSCDALFLVCLTGAVTRLLLEEAVGALRAVDALLAGLIVNRREQPTLGAEIAREARRLKRRAPKLAARIERWALASDMLDVHA